MISNVIDVNSNYKITKLNDKNYQFWKYNIKNILKQHHCYKYIDGSSKIAPIDEQDLAKWNSDRYKA